MLGQLKRDACLAANAPRDDDEPDYLPGLRLVQQLLGDSKRAADLIKKAVDAVASIKAAKSAVDELETAKARATADIDKAKAEVERLYGEHKAKVLKEQQLVDADRKAAAQARAEAEALQAKAKSYRDEQVKRLQAVERAVSGAA